MVRAGHGLPAQMGALIMGLAAWVVKKRYGTGHDAEGYLLTRDHYIHPDQERRLSLYMIGILGIPIGIISFVILFATHWDEVVVVEMMGRTKYVLAPKTMNAGHLIPFFITFVGWFAGIPSLLAFAHLCRDIARQRLDEIT